MAVGTITEITNPLTAAYGLCQMLINNQANPELSAIGQELSSLRILLMILRSCLPNTTIDEKGIGHLMPNLIKVNITIASGYHSKWIADA